MIFGALAIFTSGDEPLLHPSTAPTSFPSELNSYTNSLGVRFRNPSPGWSDLTAQGSGPGSPLSHCQVLLVYFRKGDYLPRQAWLAVIKRCLTPPRPPPFLPERAIPTHTAWELVLGTQRPVGVTLLRSALLHGLPFPIEFLHSLF
jgi:hypothetical protein